MPPWLESVGGWQTPAAFLISSMLVVLTSFLHYEVLRFTWALLPRLKIALRKRVFLVIIAIFGTHTVCVWIYGLVYWLAVNHWGMGDLSASTHVDFLTCVYFSASVYSSLGFGDVLPHGALRIMSAIEVLNGLVMISWSASFTYLVMEKFWPLHAEERQSRLGGTHGKHR